ncbi:hypothetical protein CsatA_010167 [Cannabis sativa]
MMYFVLFFQSKIWSRRVGLIGVLKRVSHSFSMDFMWSQTGEESSWGLEVDLLYQYDWVFESH